MTAVGAYATASLDSRGCAEAALALMSGADFPAEAERLLDAVGYASARRLRDQTGDPADFMRSSPPTQSKDALIAAANSIRLLFQVTDEEIAASAPQVRPGEFDGGVARSFLFIAAELSGDSYSRGDYAAFTREINKRFNIPAVVLYWTAAKRLTIAFVHRRPNKRDPNRDVVGSVSLIREINPADGNRVWIDIVAALSLDARLRWMESRKEPRNFDGLLAAWLDDLGAQELNNRFYRELFAWFERACRQAKFPKTLDPEAHVIRLITRLLFIWFIKEKGLVAPELFVERQVAPLLKDYDRDSGDSYYRAVLQNLFFATLNTEIRDAKNNPRRFSKRTRNDHRNFSLWRYEEEIANPGRLQELFSQTPFINGGLFDCLDSEESARSGGQRLDCFTDDVNQRKDYSIPNRLFFGPGGVIPIFEKYKFTLRENTPIEQDVALDPELLGKVFEKLLGAYNPETSENVRKQTGSYYTPREVVDYMVDEALAAALAENANPDDGDRQYLRERIGYLLDYADACNDARDIFTPAERSSLVDAIANLRVLDPAVGSGAFPMSVLHKLTLALRRLDPDNEEWEELQKRIAVKRMEASLDTPSQQERDAELKEISAVFEQYRDSDYGRKLYLMQNAIFGVDRQPVACQIAKLRFFISLAIEQESNGNAENNYGIRPLPNLETRIVAANTLLGVANLQEKMTSPTVEDLLRQLRSVRERHFHASARQTKLNLRKEDNRLRVQIQNELEILGMQDSYASRISSYDPYDQNARADWFDKKYTFSLDTSTKDGFDVTIGNPPYVRSETSDKLPDYREMRRQIISGGQYQTLYEKWDLYIPFIEQSYSLLNPGGFTTLIVSDAYCHARYGKKSREFFLRNGQVRRLDFLGKIQIFEAGVRNVTYLVQKANGADNAPERRVHNKRFGDVTLLPTDAQRNLTDRAFFPEDVTAPDFRAPTLPLSDICYVTYGLRPSSKPGAPDAFVTADLTTARYDDIHCKPFVEGKHLDRWLPRTNLYLEWGTDRAPDQFYAPTFPEMYEAPEKILVPRSPGANPKATYDNRNLLFTPSSVGFIRWRDLAGVRNGSVSKAARYRSEGYRADLPHREDLDESSKRFAIKFLVAVMNSAVLRTYLIANRRSNIHLYPDDWKKLPIPDVARERQEPVIALVDKILEAKASDANADTSALEDEIDGLVYDLYGLTEDEIAAVRSAASS